MKDEQIDYNKLEELVDSWIPKLLYKNIPRYSFIFHCNCAYVDLVVEMGGFFSSTEFIERYLVFGLNYLTHLAYKYLKEEDVFIYAVDNRLYKYTYNLLIEAYRYAELCDIFPKVHKGKASFLKEGDLIVVNEKELCREHMQQYEYYLLRKPLHYILQYGCGRTTNTDMENRQMAIFKLFNNYWNENIWNIDYAPYTALEGGGLRDFLMITAAKRYILLYDADFKVRTLSWTKLLICFSRDGAAQIRTMVPTKNNEFYQQALEDCIYKPLGKGDYPKANLADAPIIRTKDGCMFVNPFVLLFNNSVDTQFLNYLRRHDNKRFLQIKDKIKERCIPEVESWLEGRIKGIFKVANFEINIPYTKNRRELDLLVSDSVGNALYMEFKHFYIPESYSEKSNLDNELREAQKKMKDQIYAIKENSEEIMNLLQTDCKINRIHGIIVSYLYTGTDVDISDEYPIVSLLTVKEAIMKSTDVNGIYDFCQRSEKNHASVPIVKREVISEYANMKFKMTKTVLNPKFEKNANDKIYLQVKNAIEEGNVLKRVAYKDMILNDIIEVN